MSYLGVAPAQRNVLLLPAAIALLLTGLVSVVDVRLFGHSWPLTWLPFAVVALWPRKVGILPSAILLFLGGLWVDWTTLGAPGQWPLVFLLTYAIIRPDIRGESRGLGEGVMRFIFALLVGIPVLSVTGWIVYGQWPDIGVMLRGVGVACLCLPFLIYFRDRLAGRMSGDD